MDVLPYMTSGTGPLPDEEAQERRMNPAIYAAAFVAVQGLVLLLTLVAAATPWFLTHDAYPGMYQSGYSLRLRHADCEVLIYGDSSALTGLDPQIIQQMTGLKTCNISEGTWIQDVVGSSFPVDQYLANNRRPRYLLTMYTPSIFRPYTPPLTDYQPEGVLYALQYDRDVKMLLKLHHLLIDFDMWAGRSMILDALERLHLADEPRKSIDARAQRDSRNGIWTFPLPPQTQCIRGMYHIKPSDIRPSPESVAKMRRLYDTQGTTVLIDVSPVPLCDELRQTYDERTASLRDNKFETLPISDFNQGDVHFSPAGSQSVSIEAAKQILALEQTRKAQAGEDR